ncbi:arginine-glutamic acid dipeptide repeat protein [Trifolium repens]|nr:arginine-glutamic acid dipeptide repeat protein [Trifolium repens]
MIAGFLASLTLSLCKTSSKFSYGNRSSSHHRTEGINTLTIEVFYPFSQVDFHTWEFNSIKMNPICFDDNKEDNEVKSAEGLLTSDVSGMEDDEFGEPEVVPRVGDEFQAELPPFTAAPYFSQLVKRKGDSEIAVDMPDSFLVGLPLPLMWTHSEFDRSCGRETLESVTGQKGRGICEAKNVGGFPNFKSSYRNVGTDIDSCPELRTELDQPRNKYLLPEMLGCQSWTDIEYNSFLLGLYAFGKNLNFLKRFVGTKSMGDILFFYYGKFFRSKGYSRWSECRKSKTRRRIFGQKIFTGWRQQELLSRLFSHVAQDRKTTLVEISRNFGEGKMPFEEYVFALKDAVGIDFLIAAVAIGQGKHDLTGTALEPPKTNHIFSVRHEIPAGKACSSLTPADIIKILTGNFRLSKARSSDLFWEAVWPRLLANGWRSEEPKDNYVSGTKQTLVFLVPGVKKFSRRKLEKGKQYFDSISDVLNKVSSNPKLLETEIQATEGIVDKENMQNKQNQDGVSNTHQCPSFQSHNSKCKPDPVKFTIVDTSMVHDTNRRKVRQMKGLPFQPANISTISSCSSSESETTTSEESEDQIEEANASSPTEVQVEQANSLHHAEDQVAHANSSYCVEDQVGHANYSYRVEDQVGHANSSLRVEDQVGHANSSHRIGDQVAHANSSDHVEDQVVHANSSDRVEDQVGHTNYSYHVEDQVDHANSSDRVEDQVAHGNSSDRVEDRVEHANSSDLVDHQVEHANSSCCVEDQVEHANSSYRVVDRVEQANASSPIEDQAERTNSSYHVEHASYNHVEEISDKGMHIDSSSHAHNLETLNTTEVEVENYKCHSDLPDDEHSRELNEQPLIQKMTSDDCTKPFPCTSKMQELRACSHGEFSLGAENTSMDRNFDLNEPFSPSNPLEASEGMDFSVGLETPSFPSYPAKGSPNMSHEGSVTENHQAGEVSAKNSETRMLIDLNFPQVAPDLSLEVEIPSSKGINLNDDQWAHTLSSSSETTQLNMIPEIPDLNKEHQPSIVNRRQSTRNRPLTTKALEALEYGFLNSKRKRKNIESSDNNSKSQCLRPSNEIIIDATYDHSIGNSG